MSLAEISRVEKMYESSKKTGDYARELECLAALRLLYVREGDRAGEAKRITRIWKQRLEEIIKTKIKSLSLDQRRTYINDLRNCYKFEAEYLFESFLIFMEWKRAKQDRFYEPRKGFLKPIVDSMQRLADGELDILGISLPPRCGKTTLGLLYILWTAGRFPNESVFGSGHSTALMASFYDGTLDFATSDSYTYREIFPNGQLQAPHAKDLMLDFGTPSRYKTISFRSIDQKMSGFIEATSLLYVDDLIEDIEQALKPERLLNAYMKYEVDIKQRMANSHVPILMIGTRWSNNDPIGVEERANEDNPRAKFYAVPALNEDGESNFDFPYRGFDTNYYAQKKEAMDMIDPAIFSTVYQQTPIESEGICFHANEMNRYNGELPTDSAISTMAYIDVAWGGGDSLSMPIARTFDYGGEQRSYIIDWIFTREMKDVSLRLVVQAIIENKVQRVRVEANNGGDEYAQDLDRELRKVNYHCEITWGKASTQQSKVAKIQQYAPDIKRSFYFLYDKAMNQQYRRAFVETTSWMVTGKSPHDDAPDSLAGLCELIFGKRIGILTAIDRPRFF